MKRRLGSPLRYAGGKSRALKIITPYLPKNIPRIVSPFAGGCSLEIYWANTLPVDEVIAYDVFDILVNFWNVILSDPDRLADAMAENFTATEECYTENRIKLKKHFDGTTIIKDSVELAASYYYNHQLSYGPMFLGWSSSVYLKDDVLGRIIENVRKFKCPKLKVKLGSFESTIKSHSSDFLYLDPPYYSGLDTKVFKPIYPNPNFAIHHRGFKHDVLRDLLMSHPNEYILSYNDCPTIREWYKKDVQLFPKWHYSYQQGELRIGKNRISEGKISPTKESHEILIINTKSSDRDVNSFFQFGV